MEILNDFSTSVRKALSEIDPNYESYKGLVICGTHSPHDVELMIGKIKEARENGTPTLLICAGHQLAAIEYARNVLGDYTATSEEFKQNDHPDFPNEYMGFHVHKTINGLPTMLSQNFVVKKREDGLKIGLHEGESWWSNYEVVIDWEIPEHFISVPFHPEYQSSKEKPHPLLLKFIQNAKVVS